MLCYEGLGPEIGKGVYKPCFMYKSINFNQSENFNIFSLSFSLCVSKVFFSFLIQGSSKSNDLSLMSTYNSVQMLSRISDSENTETRTQKSTCWMQVVRPSENPQMLRPCFCLHISYFHFAFIVIRSGKILFIEAWWNGHNSIIVCSSLVK